VVLTMKNLTELRKAMKAKIDEARGIATTAQNESRSMTDEEGSRYDSLMTEIEARRKEIEREERLQQLEMNQGTKQEQDEADDRASEFRSFGDFLSVVRFRPGDERLITPEARQMQMSDGANGGFLVPTQFRTDMLQLDDPQAAIVRPRAQVIPAGDSPDAAVTIPVLDQTDSVYAGVAVEWIEEGEEKPESTTPQIGTVTLQPYEVAGTITVTDKLLRNATAAGPLLNKLLRGAILGSEDVAFLRGNGVKKPLGILNSPAVLKLNRVVALKISYDDILQMYAKVKLGGKLVWITSQSALPQLMKLKDEAGHLIWQPSAVEGHPGSLLGIPIQMNERSPLLGAYGDLMLVNLDYYLIKDGFGISISASEHVLFKQNKTVIKAFWNVDGQPWLKAPIKQENAYLVSPFVVLDLVS
jgi:HK97 family phage major capsid protein